MLFNLKIIYFYVYGYFACTYICALHMCLVTRRQVGLCVPSPLPPTSAGLFFLVLLIAFSSSKTC